MAAKGILSSLNQRGIDSRLAGVARLIRQRPAFVLGVLLVVTYIVVALIGSSLVPYGPTQTHPSSTFHPPSSEFMFGTDKFGRDILARVVYATRLDLAIAFA